MEYPTMTLRFTGGATYQIMRMREVSEGAVEPATDEVGAFWSLYRRDEEGLHIFLEDADTVDELVRRAIQSAARCR